MDTEYSYGLMVPNMKANGRTTKQMVKANCNTLTETFTKANGLMIRQKAEGLTVTLMELITKVHGSMINSMVMVSKAGQMEPNTKASILKVKKKAMDV